MNKEYKTDAGNIYIIEFDTQSGMYRVREKNGNQLNFYCRTYEQANQKIKYFVTIESNDFDRADLSIADLVKHRRDLLNAIK